VALLGIVLYGALGGGMPHAFRRLPDPHSRRTRPGRSGPAAAFLSRDDSETSSSPWHSVSPEVTGSVPALWAPAPHLGLVTRARAQASARMRGQTVSAAGAGSGSAGGR
jgi:hypothetical protein